MRARMTWALVGAAVVAALLTLGEAVASPGPATLDDAVARFTRQWADQLGWPVQAAHALGRATAPGPATLTAIVAVVVLARLGWRAAALLVAVSGLAGVVVAEVVKRTVARERPPGAEQYQDDLWRSFPSGHAMAGIYVYLLIGMVLVQLGRRSGHGTALRAGWALAVLGPTIGLSRLVLGVHWPTDVLAGWAYGSVVALGCSLALGARLDQGWHRHARPAEERSPEPAPEPGTSPPGDPSLS